MARVKYVNKTFQDEKAALVDPIQQVFDEYAAQGYLLNARAIAYRLEGQGIIRKTEESFQRVETVAKEGRDMGLFDWDGLPVDSARALRDYAMWANEAARIASAARNHLTDKWARQENRVEVWAEKEGLLGIIRGACEDEDVPFRALTGYDAIGALREGARRSMARSARGRFLMRAQDRYANGLERINRFYLALVNMDESEIAEEAMEYYKALQPIWMEELGRDVPEQHTTILYIGDHDPSGMNITETVRRDLLKYGAHDFTVRRIAITCEETCENEDPELHSAPAKVTDARHRNYVQQHGTTDAWEVESLEPAVLAGRVTAAIQEWRDENAWEEAIEAEEEQRENIALVAERWDDVIAYLRGQA